MHSIKEKNIPFAALSMTHKKINFVVDAVANNWYGNAKEYICRFEKAHSNNLFADSIAPCNEFTERILLTQSDVQYVAETIKKL